jgi:hypothetical protein
VRVTRHDSGWVPPFGHPGITAWLTAPPGLSRPPTSFIGSWCQGIHRLPLKTYLQYAENKDARVHYAHLNKQPTHTHTRNTSPAKPAVCSRRCDRRSRKNPPQQEACSFRTQQGAIRRPQPHRTVPHVRTRSTREPAVAETSLPASPPYEPCHRHSR